MPRKDVAFHTFGETRECMGRHIVRLLDDPDAPPLEISCDTAKVASDFIQRQIEADREVYEAALERGSLSFTWAQMWQIKNGMEPDPD